MKHASLLIGLCVLFSLSAVAQSTTTVEKNTSRITITTTKVDESGKTITETWIAEGKDPSEILKQMSISTEVIQKVEIESSDNGDKERIFLYRAASDKVAAEGSLNSLEPLDVMGVPLQEEKVIIVTNKDDQDQFRHAAMSTWHTNGDKPRAYAFVTVGGDRKSNCAALGVWADNGIETNGARIKGLIEKGGAQEAGLKEGDIIKNIDEFEIDNFSTLFFILSNFRPGEQVMVKYERDGKSFNTKVNLKSWAEIPNHEWRARGDCGKPELPADKNKNQPIVNDAPGLINIQPLELENVRMYPNPTDGAFALSFSTAPGPLTVSITDVNGKEVFIDRNDNTSGFYTRDVNLSDLPQGNYIIAVHQGDKVFTQQISKQ